MLEGGCLCGGVRFEIARAAGPFELCHCSRCRKSTGTAFAAMIGVRREDYRLLRGGELVARFEAPIVERPPPYRTFFCKRCGAPVPDPEPAADWFEIPAGSLDADPGERPDKHIFVDVKSTWFDIADALPQHTKAELVELRRRATAVDRPDGRSRSARR